MNILLSSLHLFLLMSITLPFGSTQTTNHEDLQKQLNEMKTLLTEVRGTVKQLQAEAQITALKITGLEEKTRLQDLLIKELLTKNDNNKVVPLNGGKVVSAARTCEEIRSADPSNPSDFYWIDPDGAGQGDPAFQVYCDMTTGATMVPHDSEDTQEVGHCYDPGCYSRVVNYNATIRQMNALVKLSQQCRQHIRYDCMAAPLQLNGVDFSWWNDKDGQPQYYWAGSNASVHTCQCGLENNCRDQMLKCNCDTGEPTILSDQGYLSNKEDLPVTQLNFGHTDPVLAIGRHTLGRLECSGRVTLPGKPTSCSDLWLIGHTLSGFYNVQRDKELLTVYCDFSQLPGDSGLETRIGIPDVKSNHVAFRAYRSTSFTPAAGVIINYEHIDYNLGDGMNITTGIFTTPKSGMYSFSFKAQNKDPSKYINVDLRTNKEEISDIIVDGIGAISFTNVLGLKVGDQIKLHNYGSMLFDNNTYFYTQFSGILLQEDLF